jgi:hypothetical protein
MVLKAGKSKIKVTGGFLIFTPKWCLDGCILWKEGMLLFLHGGRQKDKKGCRPNLPTSLVPPMRVGLSWANHLLKVQPLNSVTMAIKFQHEFWRKQTFKP